MEIIILNSSLPSDFQGEETVKRIICLIIISPNISWGCMCKDLYIPLERCKSINQLFYEEKKNIYKLFDKSMAKNIQIALKGRRKLNIGLYTYV